MNLPAVLLVLCGVAGAQGATDEVRRAREVSNRAILERKLPQYAGTITPDFVITTGGGKTYARDEFLAMWSKLFTDATWLGCNRIVDGIEMSTSQPAAAERGHFVCASEQTDGKEVYTGTYLAMWRKDAGGWKTRSELFVTLACTGSCRVYAVPKL